MIICKKPSECSDQELQVFKALVQDAGEVETRGLESRINQAEILLFLLQGYNIQGIAAIKNPNSQYKEQVFSKAQVFERPKNYSFELGWVFVAPTARGNGYSHQLVEKALAAVENESIFSTSHSKNTRMHKTLERYGFECHGKQYPSKRGSYFLTLFLRDSAQQGTQSGRALRCAG